MDKDILCQLSNCYQNEFTSSFGSKRATGGVAYQRVSRFYSSAGVREESPLLNIPRKLPTVSCCHSHLDYLDCPLFRPAFYPWKREWDRPRVYWNQLFCITDDISHCLRFPVSESLIITSTHILLAVIEWHCSSTYLRLIIAFKNRRD